VIVSVVIPMYNAAPWVGETLDSVVSQTQGVGDLEVIVVDDASIDDSVSVARTFFDRHLIRGQLITLDKNGGVGAARNVGWRHARGDWVQFLDADDILAPAKIERQSAAAERMAADVAVVYSNWQNLRLQNDGWRPSGSVICPQVDEDPVVQIVRDFLFGYVGPTLVRTAALRMMAGFREHLDLGEDADLMLRLAMAGGRFHKVESSEPLFFYRDTPHSLWRHSINNVESICKMAHVYRDVELFLRERDRLSAAARQGLIWRYCKSLPFFVEQDRRQFSETLQWIAALGPVECPPGTRTSMRFAAHLLGYQNVLRLRGSYRQTVRTLRAVQ